MSESKRLTQLITKTAEGKCFNKKYFIIKENITVNSVSIIIPVKDNLNGLLKLIDSIEENLANKEEINEIIIVDNNSKIPLIKENKFQKMLNKNKYKIIYCEECGAAAARNAGVRIAQGNWLLFIDSDCLVTASTIEGYKEAMNGSIGYAGNVKALGNSFLDEYYDCQKTLLPPPIENRPAYLVTANTLIYKPAFNHIGGFDTIFTKAGGEDIDLALRLSSVGSLSYAINSTVYHDFFDDLRDFLKRFHRYGIGNYLIEQKYHISMIPLPFLPEKKNILHFTLAIMQFLAMLSGYLLACYTKNIPILLKNKKQWS